jgi:hypothetical protein
MAMSGPGGPWNVPIEIAGPGEEISDYTLAPLGSGFAVRNGSTVVEARTLFGDLLEPNMGTGHWAACRGRTHGIQGAGASSASADLPADLQRLRAASRRLGGIMLGTHECEFCPEGSPF